jgi:hypothetical protein
MHTHNILVPEKCGFRQGSYAENAAFKLPDNVLKSISQKNACWWNILLFSKSVCVNHEILLVKLHYYGIQGTVSNKQKTEN